MRYIWRENYFVIVPKNVLIPATFLQRYELSAQKQTKQNLGIRSHMHMRLKGVLNRPGNNHISNEGLFPLIPTKDLNRNSVKRRPTITVREIGCKLLSVILESQRT